jgi:hypothetical protein
LGQIIHADDYKPIGTESKEPWQISEKLNGMTIHSQNIWLIFTKTLSFFRPFAERIRLEEQFKKL